MELILFIGLQASGKSTFYHTHFAATHAYVSKDRLRNNRRPGRRQAQLVEAALRAGRSVVVDNTHPAVADRAEVIAQGRAHSAEIIGYYFEPDVALSLARNRQRSGRERVPDVAIYVTKAKLVRPEYAEGFDRLYDVRAAADLAFTVRPWPRPDGTLPPLPPMRPDLCYHAELERGCESGAGDGSGENGASDDGGAEHGRRDDDTGERRADGAGG